MAEWVQVPHPKELLGVRLVLWRNAQGAWSCFEDRCPHRLAPLSGNVASRRASGLLHALVRGGIPNTIAWQFQLLHWSSPGTSTPNIFLACEVTGRAGCDILLCWVMIGTG